MVISQLLNFTPEEHGTDLNKAIQYMTQGIKKRCTAFVISDFIDDNDYSTSLSIANHKHDMIAIQVYDKREEQLPNVGLIRVMDAESGSTRWVDTSRRSVRRAHDSWWSRQQMQLHSTMQRAGVDFAQVATGDDYAIALMSLFKHRGVRR